jgi:hypothetical protein
MAGWLLMGVFTFAPVVEATTCGQTSIETGSVTPGTGTTATTFTFGVTVSDRTGAKPASVVVRVVGLFKPMTTTDTDVRAGLAYRLSIELPVGSWSYWFRVRTGSGIDCDLKVVDPAIITIEAPSPTPDPAVKPTPRPSDLPAASDAAPSSAEPVTSSEPESSPGSTASPAPIASPTPEAGSVGAGFSGGGTEPPTDAASPGLDLIGPIVIWLLTSAGGVWLFLFLVRRSGDGAPGGLMLAGATAGAVGNAPVPASAPALDLAPSRPTGRGTMLPPVPPRTFDKPPANGIERAKIGYRRVRINSKPDSIRSVERGRLERGDEVEILDSYEGYLEIRTPDGITGWILRHTIVG